MAEIVNKKIFNFYEEVRIPQEIMQFINSKEKALFAVKTVRDVALFTSKKILICDKQGLTGKKTEYFVIPYSKIITYAIETAGHFDLDSEIKITLSGGMEIEFNFMKSRTMNQVLFKVFNTIDNYVIE